MVINTIIVILIAIGALAIFFACCNKTKILYENKSKDLMIYEQSSKRFMVFNSYNKVIQSAYDCNQPLKIVLSYQKLIIACATLLAKAPEKIAIIGLGGGNLTAQLRRLYPEAMIIHFEKEERMLDYAQRYFHLRVDPKMQFIWGDAYEQLPSYSQPPQSQCFDLIIVDAFEGDRPVPTFSTQEFCYTLLQSLSATGVALINSLSNQISIKNHRAAYINTFDYVSECYPESILERNYIRWVGYQPPAEPNLKNHVHIIKLQGLNEAFIKAAYHSLVVNRLQNA